MTTPILGAPSLAQSQAVPETTVNEIARFMEQGAGWFRFKDFTATPPGSPADGDCYLVAGSATGAWAGQDGKIAFRLSTAWKFITPKEGMAAWLADDDVAIAYDGTAWSAIGGGITDGDKGDITVAGGGSAFTIEVGAVTYAKMQDVSAASRLLGRGSLAGSGDVQEIALGPGLTMAGNTLSTDSSGGGGGIIPASLAQYWAAGLEPDAIEALQFGDFIYTVDPDETKLLLSSFATRLGSGGRMEQRNPSKPMPLRGVTLTGLQSVASGSPSAAFLIDPTLPVYTDAAATYYERQQAIMEMQTRNITLTAANQSKPFLPGPYGAMILQQTAKDFAWIGLFANGNVGLNLWDEISDSASQRTGDSLMLPAGLAMAGELRSSSFSTGTPVGSLSYVLLPSTWSKVADPVASSYVWQDDFMGSALDTGVWTRVQSTTGNVEIDTNYAWCKVRGNGTWGANSAYKTTGYARSANQRYVFDVYIPSAATASQGVLVQLSDGAGHAIANGAHMVAFANGFSLNIFENGTQRAANANGYSAGSVYRVRITPLSGGGATYEIQGGKEYPSHPRGGATWHNLTPGTSSSPTNTLYPSFSAFGAHDYHVGRPRAFAV